MPDPCFPEWCDENDGTHSKTCPNHLVDEEITKARLIEFCESAAKQAIAAYRILLRRHRLMRPRVVQTFMNTDNRPVSYVGGVSLHTLPDMTPEPTPDEIREWLRQQEGIRPGRFAIARVLEARDALIAERETPPQFVPHVLLPADWAVYYTWTVTVTANDPTCQKWDGDETQRASAVCGLPRPCPKHEAAGPVPAGDDQ